MRKTKTEKVIEAMLKENTGISMLDSGGAYGRHWEKNQDRDFEKESPCDLSFEDGKAQVEHNLYHWLVERLEFDAKVQEDFDQFAQLGENEDKGWLVVMEAYPKFLRDKGGIDIGGIYGDGDPNTVNTYNHGSLLSQVIQYVYWQDRDSEQGFVLLQIHNGCDVRGGYTAPKAFKVLEELSIFNDSRASILCKGRKGGKNIHSWSTDDCGYHWYADWTDGKIKNLEDYILKVSQKSKTGLCPICGTKLEAYF